MPNTIAVIAFPFGCYTESMQQLGDMAYADAVDWLRNEVGFDLVALGLLDDAHASLKWKHSSGTMGDQLQRIELSPGRGIGGIVLKACRPMMFTDIDTQMDPREYSSYPIVFAEGLRSFCALPLKRGPIVAGVLLCAYRTVDDIQLRGYSELFESVSEGLCGFTVIIEDLPLALSEADPAERFVKPDIEDLLESSVDLAHSRSADPYKTLSPKELEIFAMLARGFTNKEISRALSLSVKTVEAHRSKIYRKLGVETRAQLVHTAIRHQVLGF